MNYTLIVLLIALVVSGCQMSVRMGAGSLAPHTHEALAAPAPAAGVVAKVDGDNAPVCPSAPAAIECPAAAPTVTSVTDTQSSPAAANTADVNSVATQSPDTQSQNTQAQEQHSEQHAQPAQSDTTDVAAVEKPSAAVESFDIEKYIEQSASCVQQRPCSVTQQEISPPQPKVLDQPKTVEPAKVAEHAKPADLTIDRKAVGVESGIQRVDRKRVTPSRVESPPDMPR